ncbi:hypothetical protein SKAU_G00086550 [Synaphobranchus kaupii]|uniref:Uncharacterized protein n=1 Tax=Synaphobranchus kaupii TaxID=118154 RepID=A0A9Q1J4Z5_SYNKA|nr:hypothetical protein SKAU_G00086550 [Synaphobranchus kaupii]
MNFNRKANVVGGRRITRCGNNHRRSVPQMWRLHKNAGDRKAGRPNRKVPKASHSLVWGILTCHCREKRPKLSS